MHGDAVRKLPRVDARGCVGAGGEHEAQRAAESARLDAAVLEPAKEVVGLDGARPQADSQLAMVLHDRYLGLLAFGI